MRYRTSCTIITLAISIIIVIYTSVTQGASYYLRADGTSANKTSATSCSAASTAMSVDTHNEATFFPDDIIQLCDDGGDYKSSIIVPSDGSDGHPIVYQNADGDTPTIDLSVNVGSSDWEDMGGGIYRKKGFGRVFWEDGIPLKAASSNALIDGSWHYVLGSGVLYYKPTNGSPTGHSIRTLWFGNNWTPHAIDARLRSNIEVRGLTITRSGSGVGFGHVVDGTKTIAPPLLKNINIHHNKITHTFWGIWAQAVSSGVIEDVRIDNNFIDYCNSGISAWTGSDSSNVPAGKVMATEDISSLKTESLI